MTRRRCLDCQDGRRCRHRGYVPTGMILAPCRCLDCDPEPIQARLFSHGPAQRPGCLPFLGGRGSAGPRVCCLPGALALPRATAGRSR